MSIFKSTFRDGVKTQIEKRQEAIYERTPDSIQYFNSRNAWIRMTSAVDVNGDNGALAKDNILLGGTLLNLGNSRYALKSGVGENASNAYSLKTSSGQTHRLGIRPMPGITSIDVRSKAAYGSLREIVVNFQCWDIRQLEDLELLYMRPGYSVLVEWGWNPYLDNSKNLQFNTRFIEEVINGGKTKEEIWKLIYDKSTTDGNYDAIYGFIKNFSWSARQDGGYDCTTTIITMGEIIESLKINYGAFNVDDIVKKGIWNSSPNSTLPPFAILAQTAAGTSPSIFSNNQTPQPYIALSTKSQDNYSQNIIAGICSELYDRAITEANAKSTTQRYTLLDQNNNFTYELLRYNIKAKGEQTPTISQSGQQVYITLESFVEILNKYVLINDSNKPIAALSIREPGIGFGGNGNKLLCLGSIYQISTNPLVCLIKNDAYLDPLSTFKIDLKTDSIKGYLNSIPPNLTFLDNTTEFGTIGNIYINLDYIYRLSVNNVLESQDKKEKNNINLFDFIKNMMDGINTAIGNIAAFDIFVDPLDSVCRIIDVNYIDLEDRNTVYNNTFQLQIHKLDSIIRNYKFESQIFPDQISTIAIGAQAQGGVLGEDVNTLIDFNQNLIDRIVPKKETWNTTPATNTIQDLKDKLNNLQKNWEIISKYFVNLQSSWWSPGEYDIEQSSYFTNSLRDIISYFNSYLKSNNKNRSILPTKLSLEMDGIGGLIIGTLFKIPDDILPRGYRGGGAGPKKIAYVVTGIGHSIQNNDWVTKIDAQFIILDEPLGLDRNTSLSLIQATNFAATSPTPNQNVRGNNFVPLNSGKSVANVDDLGINFTQFVYPCTGVITSDFGNRIVMGTPGFHRGLDIANKINTPIYSVCYGEVVQIGASGYGNSAIYIKVDNLQYGLKTSLYVIYGHNESSLVKKGDKVSPGQQIAYMGSKGRSTGPHLHLQLQNSLTSAYTSYVYGSYFPYKRGTITALAPWGSLK